MVKIRFLTAVCCCLFAAQSFAATLWVGTSQPYTTIQSAINAAANGDEIVVKRGTYTEHLDFRGTGTWAKQITLRSESGSALTTIRAATANTLVTIIGNSSTPSTGIRFEGFTLENGVGTVQNVSPYTGVIELFSAGGGFYMRHINGSTFRDLVVRNCNAARGGGFFVLFCNQNLFDRCNVNNNTAAAGGGFSFLSSNTLTNTLRNCLLTKNTVTQYWGGALRVDFSSIVNLEHCTLANNVTTVGSGGAAVGLANAGVLNCTNSIFYKNGSARDAYAFVGGWASFFNVNNSNVEYSTTGSYSFMVKGANVIDQNPSFDADFKLLPFSPCIDAGLNSTITQDIIPNCRPIGTTADMGCFEMSVRPDTFYTCVGQTIILRAPAGGTSHRWSTGATTPTVNIVAALGTRLYNVQVVNPSGCVYTKNFVIYGIALPIVSIGVNTLGCGDSTLLTANTSNSSTYLWSTGATSPTVKVNAGTYSVTVSSGGCQATASYTVVRTSPLVIGLVAQNVVCNGTISTATVNIRVAGGIPPYRYRWSNGVTTPDLTGATGNSKYCVTVTDARGCQTVRCFDCLNPCADANANMAASQIPINNALIIKNEDKTPKMPFDTEGVIALTNAPNPFSQKTEIQYVLPREFEKAEVVVTDLMGRVVQKFQLNESKGSVNLSAETVSNGILIYSLVVDNKVLLSKKMVVNK